jgi:tetratricopeptide (TPR) repeat protein
MPEAVEISELPPGRTVAQLTTTAIELRDQTPPASSTEQFFKPRHSASIAIAFNFLWPAVCLLNLGAAILGYSLSSHGLVFPGFYQHLVSISTALHVWVAVAIAACAILPTATAYLFSLDHRREARPSWRLYILFTSFCVYLAGLALGSMKVFPAQWWAFLLGLLAALVLPLLMIFAEEAMALLLTHLSEQLLHNNSPSAARSFARSALRFRPGSRRTEQLYGLALMRTGRAASALPYLVRDSSQLDALPIPVLSAVVDAFQATDRSAESLAALEALHRVQPTSDTFQRLIDAWLAVGRKAEVLRALQSLPPKERLRWTDTLSQLIFEEGDLEKSRAYCRDTENIEGPPYAKARDCYTRLLQLHPEDLALNRAVIELSRRRGDARYSAQLLERVIELDPERALEDRRTLASYYWTQGERESMLRHLASIYDSGRATLQEKLQIVEEHFTSARYAELEDFIHRDPHLQFNPRALGTLAHALHLQHRLNESLRAIESVRQLEHGELSLDLQTLEQQINRGLLDTEIGALETQVAAHPNDTALQFQLAEKLARAGQHERAVNVLLAISDRDDAMLHRARTELTSLASRNPNYAGYSDALIQIELRMRNADAAFQLLTSRTSSTLEPTQFHDGLQTILQVCPTHRPSLVELLRYFLRHDNATVALDHIDAYLAAAGQPDATLHQLEFEAATAAGQLDRAEQAGKRVLESRAPDPVFLVRLSEVAIQLDRFDDAQQFLQQAQQANPENDLYETLLHTLDHKRQRARIDDLEKQLSVNSATPEIHEELGDLHQQLGEFGPAMTHYQRATYGAPERRVARAKLAHVFARRGLHQEADETLQETELSLNLAPAELDQLKDLFYQCAELMERDDEPARALATFRRVLRVEAGYRDVVPHVERLQRAQRNRPGAS